MHDTLKQFFRVFVLLCAAVLGSAAALADDTVSSRGFHAGEVHQYNDFDSVNQFNGNLGLAVPLGQTFRTNGSLQYGFSIRYNSQLWNLRNWGDGTNQDPGGGTHGSWRGEGETMEAYPASTFNAGLGWHFAVSGRIVWHPGDVVIGPGETSLPDYADSTGAEHSFGTALHQFGAGATVPVGFSNDSSYYRMRKGDSYYIVDRPDGIQERFQCVAGCGTAYPYWDLDQMSDPYGHVLYVTRAAEPSTTGATWNWTYTEAVGNEPYPDHNVAALTTLRVHGATFKKTGDPYAPYHIVSLALASSADGDAVYLFSYDENVGIIRPEANTYGGRNMVYPVSGGTAPENRIKSWLLKTLTLPSTTNSEGGSWAFDYIVVPGAPDYPNSVTTLTWTTSTGNTVSWETSHYSGLLRSAKLPVGGKVEYKYGTRGFSKRFCDTTLPAARGNFGYIGVGVRQRQIVKANGQNDGRPWLYHGHSYNNLPGSCQIREFIGTTIDPLGNATSTFFSVYFDGDNPDGSWKRAEYGLPFSKFESAAPGLYLSTRVMQCEVSQLADFENPSTAASAFRRMHPRWLQSGETLSCGKTSGGAVLENKLRSTYGRWEYAPGPCGSLSPECGRLNERLKVERVVYHDDGGAFTETTYDEFDGLGHYRSVKTGGDFYSRNFPNGTGGDERIDITNYNPGFVFTGTGFSATDGKDLKTMPWLLDLYDLTVASQAPNGQAGGGGVKAASVLYRFNGTTGFLERKRVAKKDAVCGRDAVSRAQCFNSTVLDGADLVFDSTRTRQGDTITVVERLYGGDNAGLPISDLSAAPPGDPAYIREKLYKAGTLQRSSYLGCTNETILREEDNDVDSETGLVLRSRDSAGAETAYTYDHLGRYLSVDPAGTDAPTFYRYVTASSSAPGKVVIETKNGATVLRDSEVIFDHWGRVGVEREKFATGATAASWSWAYRVHEYHPNNWILSVSTMGPEGAGGPSSPLAIKGKTEYQDYDPFGRPQRVDLPDGSGRYVVYSYAGVRSVVETRHGLAVKGDSKAVVSRKYDRFGNIVAVNEESLSVTPNEARTVYEYDVRDRLTKVLSPNSQTRTMSYDMRGFLLSETHPELYSVGIRYENYDAMGHAGRKRYSAANEPFAPQDLQYLYDGAGRLIEVKELAANRTIKSFRYHPQSGNNIPALSAGKLRSSVRDNWIPAPAELQKPRTDVPVTHEYRYDPSTGRMSGKLTLAGGFAFDVAYAYNALGKASSVTYPLLKACETCTAVLAGPARMVTMDYVQGMLVRLPGYASSITYHPSGAIKQVIHVNRPGDPTKDTKDLFEADPHSLPRAASITTTFANASSWFMDLDYDAAGNVTKAGGQTYLYDKVHRLVEASISGAIQTFAYDANGNLVNFNGTPLSITPSTNRLAVPGTTYDRAGNVLTWTDPRRPTLPATYEWDAALMLVHHKDPRQGKIFVYDANDERVASIDYVSANPEIIETWTARGLENEPLRDFVRRRTKDNATLSWAWRDLLHRDGVLLAEASGTGVTGETEVRHVHVDHLGSVRRVSGRDGVVLEQREFYPYGQEIGEKSSGTRIRFAGHERDNNGALDPFGDLDYMHARYYGMMIGRFLSVDPVEGSAASPQSWNRYAYSRNNPASLYDPDGNAPNGAWKQMTGDRGWADDGHSCISPTEASERRARAEAANAAAKQREAQAEAERQAIIQDYLQFRRSAPYFPEYPTDGYIWPLEGHHEHGGHDEHAEGHGGGHDPHKPHKPGRLRGEGSEEDWEAHREENRLDDWRPLSEREREEMRRQLEGPGGGGGRSGRFRGRGPFPPNPNPRWFPPGARIPR